MLFGSLWFKNIRVLHLILDNGPTHPPKQIKKWIRSLDLPFRGKIHRLRSMRLGWLGWIRSRACYPTFNAAGGEK